MNVVYSKNFDDSAREEIVISEERGTFIETFLFVDELPKTVDLKIRLAGRGSRAEITVLYIGRSKDETEMNITITHETLETYGRVIVKAALFDESRLTVRGMIEIEEGARGADSYLLAKALLVSPKARAEIRPELEILTDEVKASHGTSIGRIDERQLFYLQSRGIAEEDGRRLLLTEFFRDVAKDLSSEDKKSFFRMIEDKNPLFSRKNGCEI
ncbi:MAG: SufD family Fe-S cluster assembly protein [Candidatus Sungbacteria bacterium]|nr:SufD family Fe-S cluster assembly protein [Candidatus Sungbacteria bacterium]